MFKLWLSVLIFSAANSVIAKLGHLGAMHTTTDGRNPISFCNVLFAANIIAGITLLLIHRKAWNKNTLSSLKKRDWLNMTILALLSGVIAPTLFFLGLMLTEVINVVLISTFDIPLTLLLAWLISKERPTFGTLFASLFAVSGIIAIFFLYQNPMAETMKMTMINIGEGPVAYLLATLPHAGEICIAVATFFTVYSVIFSRSSLANIPTGIYSVYRMIVGAIIFFIVVLVMLGWIHFIDIFNPFLLEWMLIYGGGIIALGLYLWYKALTKTTASEIAIVNSFQPIAGVFFAYLILGEIPQQGQIIGGTLILIGIAIGLFAKLHKPKKLRPQKPSCFSGV